MSSQIALETKMTPAIVLRSMSHGLVDSSPSNAAFEKRLEEIRSVDDDALAPLNLDIRRAIMTVFGALREIAIHRNALSTLSWIDQNKIDGLEEYTLAAVEAQSRWTTAMTPPKNIVALNAQALAMRDTLRSDARALAKRGLIARECLASFRGHVGYKNVGFELLAWANLIRDRWSAIQGKTPLTVAEVQRAKDIGERLIHAAGFREQAPRVQTEAARLRQQAFTLMLNAYDETRRAISFLRWHEGDADTIAPSLYAGRRRSAARAERSRVSVAASSVGVGDSAIADGRGIEAGIGASVPVVAKTRRRRLLEERYRRRRRRRTMAAAPSPTTTPSNVSRWSVSRCTLQPLLSPLLGVACDDDDDAGERDAPPSAPLADCAGPPAKMGPSPPFSRS